MLSVRIPGGEPTRRNAQRRRKGEGYRRAPLSLAESEVRSSLDFSMMGANKFLPSTLLSHCGLGFSHSFAGACGFSPSLLVVLSHQPLSHQFTSIYELQGLCTCCSCLPECPSSCSPFLHPLLLKLHLSSAVIFKPSLNTPHLLQVLFLH